MPGYGRTDFLATASQVDGRKMLGKRNHQNLSSSSVILIEHYTYWLHISP